MYNLITRTRRCLHLRGLVREIVQPAFGASDRLTLLLDDALSLVDGHQRVLDPNVDLCDPLRVPLAGCSDLVQPVTDVLESLARVIQLVIR